VQARYVAALEDPDGIHLVAEVEANEERRRGSEYRVSGRDLAAVGAAVDFATNLMIISCIGQREQGMASVLFRGRA